MPKIDTIKLDELLTIEDALEAIKLGAPATREEYLAMHKEYFKDRAGAGWDLAVERFRAAGTIRKALNQVQREIEEYR